MLPWFLGFAHLTYAIVSALGGLGMLWLALDICRKPGDMGPAKRMFGYSILYLFVLFACLLGEALVLRVMA